MMWILVGLVALLLFSRQAAGGGLVIGGPAAPPIPGDGGGVTPQPVPTIPGAPVINCIRAPCPGSTIESGRLPDDTDAPWWATL